VGKPTRLNRKKKAATMILAQRLTGWGSTRVRKTIRIGVNIKTAIPSQTNWFKFMSAIAFAASPLKMRNTSPADKSA
jgi:hypothetical protein